MLREQVRHFFAGQGFGEVVGDGHRLQALHVLRVEGGSEHGDDRALAEGLLAVSFEKFQPVHDGHFQVEQHEGRAGRRIG